MATAWLSEYAMTGAASAQPTPIKHIVVLYLENHSFDNVLGYWCNQKPAIDGGRMDGWQGVAGCGAKTGYACISGYPPAHVPNLAALAHKFAISDRTFSMADSPSWGGHLYAAKGSLDGFLGNNPIPARGVTPRPGWGCDSRHLTQWERPREQCSYDLDAPVSGPVEVEEEEQPPRQPAAGLVPGRGGSRYGVGFSTVSQ